MTSLRILHVEDDPDIRYIVEIALRLDPTFTVASSATGRDALAVAADWRPDLILCDVMMPEMDGLVMLKHLRARESTANIPVIFVTACVQPEEHERFKSLGVATVITKPFDPMKLAATVRSHVNLVRLATVDHDFAQRLRNDAAALVGFREKLRPTSHSPTVSEALRSCAHKLAGVAGIFGFQALSLKASVLEDAIVENNAGRSTTGKVEACLDALIECIARELPSERREPATCSSVVNGKKWSSHVKRL